ncbi:MlaD family protein [Ferruginibacter sp. SUN002]|uniref:MlaD family protein n=1 Tax=Ferruginibacter sp. SUN002 TaxID=2937789 RepID=UPI003D36EC57
MTISNETKVGALTSIAIVLLILGFNFLKGKSFSNHKTQYYAIFDNIKGLANSNPVMINGKQVGTVFSTDGGLDMRKITVTLNMSLPVNIPANSVAFVTSSPLGNTALEIKLGDSTKFYRDGDTILTKKGGGMLDAVLEKVDPVLFQVSNSLRDLDSILISANSLFDPNTKSNIRNMIDNLNHTTASLSISSASLQTLLNTQTGALAKTLNNVGSFTETLAKNNDKMTGIITNVEKTTATFSKLDLENTLTTLNGTISNLKTTIGKINSDTGTLGLLMNDKKLYNNLTASTNKLNLLLDDLRLHPKRYINISVFGKKEKEGPLMVPLPDTVNAPYIKQ